MSAGRKAKEVTLIGQKRAKSNDDPNACDGQPAAKRRKNQTSVDSRCGKSAQRGVGPLNAVSVKKIK